VKDQYINHILREFILTSDFDALFGDTWIDDGKFEENVLETASRAFLLYGFRGGERYFGESSNLFAALLDAKVIVRDGDEYSGFWYKLRPPTKAKILAPLHAESPATQRVERLGEEALRRSLIRIASEDGLEVLAEKTSDEEGSSSFTDEESENSQVPASDRIVTLGHNQTKKFEEPIESLVSLVEAENSIDGEGGLRELVLGRIRAGRELIRAGVFSLKSLELTLIVGLQMLIEKYKDHAISALAGNLLAQIIEAIKT